MMPSPPAYEAVIGLEVHAQLLTRTKLFCGDTTAFGLEPNSQVSVISLGHPGTLPRLNKEAIALAVKLGLACNSEISRHNYFARKNYFYPDLPKGYQITQHTSPICKGGFVEINLNGSSKKIFLNRIHLEEDAGKSLHVDDGDVTHLDYNRAGMPLLEIVTEPVLSSGDEAYAYVTALRKLVRHLGVCDGNMEEGSLRCDVNISIRQQGDPKLGTKVEIKNLNSVRFIRKAIEFEKKRLISLMQKGEPILQETRGFDETDYSTFSIRVKEDEDDYRYFPEPDLPPFSISEKTLEEIKLSMPPLPAAVRARLEKEYQLSSYDAMQLSEDTEMSLLFLKIAEFTTNYKAIANWVNGPVRNHLVQNELAAEEFPVPASTWGTLINMIDREVISYGLAVQQVFPQLVKDPSLNIEQLVASKGLDIKTSVSELDTFIEAALEKYSEKITEYKKGKKGLISLFVGEVMKQSHGRADAKTVTERIIELLKTK